MKPFRELSRRGRLRRLRKLAEIALSAYGLAGARLSFIQYGENIIYRVDAPDPIPLNDADTIESELTWLAALSQEAGLPVPAPVSRPDGRRLATILTPGIPHGRIVSLMRCFER